MNDGGITLSLTGVLALVGFLITVGSVVAAAVWAVATIRGTTMALGAEMRGLAESIDRLRSFVMAETKELRDNIVSLRGRIIKVETRNGISHDASSDE